MWSCSRCEQPCSLRAWRQGRPAPPTARSEPPVPQGVLPPDDEQHIPHTRALPLHTIHRSTSPRSPSGHECIPGLAQVQEHLAGHGFMDVEATGHRGRFALGGPRMERSDKRRPPTGTWALKASPEPVCCCILPAPIFSARHFLCVAIFGGFGFDKLCQSNRIESVRSAEACGALMIHIGPRKTRAGVCAGALGDKLLLSAGPAWPSRRGAASLT